MRIGHANWVLTIKVPSLGLGRPKEMKWGQIKLTNAFCIPILMHASPPLILSKRRMRNSVRTDLCGGRSAMAVPTATVSIAVNQTKSNYRIPDHSDTNREVRRSGRGLCAAKHWARVTVTADGHDLSICHVNMLGEGNGAEDCVDVEDGDAVFAIDNKADNVDALHDAGKLIEALLKRRNAAIRVRGELADRIRMKRKSGGVVTPHRINVLFDYLNHLFAHDILGSVVRL
jgi:hypothetical protein